ncbi:MAG: deoxyribose-phosphate aldolase [Epulopiscium sp.]|nr:deoxyribose-phosphate aldolase [Candidatus Epulonipiscium sp.]
MNIASYIDHTLLKPDAQRKDIIRVCAEAKQYGFASVCVNSYYTSLVKEQLKNSEVKVCVVVGFPLGATFTEIKAAEAKMAIEKGADEIDMVINIGALKDGDNQRVKKDIQAVVDVAKNRAKVKVIIETCLLTEEEKERACRIALSAGADFVKTSTGFSTGGAMREDVLLMKRVVGEKAQVKASGGIRDYETAVKMIEAGADRIGASQSIYMIK